MSERPYRGLFHRGGLASALVLLLLGAAAAFSVSGFNPITVSVSAGQPPKALALGYNAQSAGADVIAAWIEEGGASADSVLVRRSADKGVSFGAITQLAPPTLDRSRLGIGMSGDRVLVAWFERATNELRGRFSSDFGVSYQDSKALTIRPGVVVDSFLVRGTFPATNGLQTGTFGMLWTEDGDALIATSTNFFAGASADTISQITSTIAAAATTGLPNTPKLAYNIVGSGATQMDIFNIAWHGGTTVHMTQIRRTSGGESSLVGIWPDNTLPIDASLLISAQAGAVSDVDIACANDGRVFLLWVQNSGGEDQVFFDRNIFSGTPSLGTSPGDSAGMINSAFGPDVTLSAVDGFSAEKCRILLDPDGTLHAFWLERSGTTRRLIHLQSPDGGSSWATSVTRDTQTISSATTAVLGTLFDVGYSMLSDDKLHVIVADTPIATPLVRYAGSGNLSNPSITAAFLTDGDSSGTVSKGDTLALTFSETITIPSGVTLVASMFSLPVTLDTFGGSGLTIQKTASNVIQIKLGDSPTLTLAGTFSSATTSAGSPSGINMAGTDTRIVDNDSNPVVASATAVDIGGSLALVVVPGSGGGSEIGGGGTPDDKRGTDSLCAASRANASGRPLGVLRTLRELLLATPFGRLVALFYYFLS